MDPTNHPPATGLWTAEHLRSGTDPDAPRGHSAYLYQDVITADATERSYRQLERRYPAILAACQEPGDLGAVCHEVDGRLVSRDLLDSVAEIGFLSEHIDLANAGRLIDVGAGYGRLAHRLHEVVPSLAVTCADAIAASTDLCRRYLGHRGVDADIVTAEEVRGHMTQHPPSVATAIHSIPEMSLASIEWWLRALTTASVRCLFLVPNEVGDLRSSELDGSRWSFEGLLAECGYHLFRQRMKYFGDGPFIYQDEFRLYEVDGSQGK